VASIPQSLQFLHSWSVSHTHLVAIRLQALLSPCCCPGLLKVCPAGAGLILPQLCRSHDTAINSNNVAASQHPVQDVHIPVRTGAVRNPQLLREAVLPEKHACCNCHMLPSQPEHTEEEISSLGPSLAHAPPWQIFPGDSSGMRPSQGGVAGPPCLSQWPLLERKLHCTCSYPSPAAV